MISSYNEVVKLNNNRVISFPAGETYNLAIIHKIHAHPIKKGYPKEIPHRLALRQTGSLIDEIFEVIDVIDLTQEEIDKNENLPEQLTSYINERKQIFHFKPESCPYRFYILNSITILKKTYKVTGGVQSLRYHDFKDLINCIQKEVIELTINDNIWSIDTKISKADWINFLKWSDKNNPLTDKMLTFLKRWYIQPNETGSWKEIYSGIYGESNISGFELVYFVERVLNFLNRSIEIIVPNEDNTNSKTWPIVFNGFYTIWENTHVFSYIMKSELVSAINEIDIAPYTEWQKIKNNEEIYKKVILNNQVSNINKLLSKINDIDYTTKEVIAKARIGQSQYRRLLIAKYRCKCALCNIRTEALLTASHIKPWAKCKNIDEQLDYNNGLLLCSNHDSLFDKHLITINKDGSISISDLVNKDDIEILNIPKKVDFEINDKMEYYLKHHRKEFLKQVKKSA